jgi:hypothetical protein
LSPALIAALALLCCSRAQPQLSGPKSTVVTAAAVRPARDDDTDLSDAELIGSDWHAANRWSRPCAHRGQLIRQCPIRKIQKMPHIPPTVGRVVLCLTFHRGSGCLTLSNVSWRRSKARAQADLCRAIADGAIKIQVRLKKHASRATTSKEVLQGTALQIPRELKPAALDFERSCPVKPWIVRCGSYSPSGYWYLEWIEVCRADVTNVFCAAKERDETTRHAPSETPASTSRPALESQKAPMGPGPSSTAGPRKRAAAPARRRGARPLRFEKARDAMRNDIQQGGYTVAQLDNMLEKNLATTYGVSRDTARKARKAILSELNSRQIPTNDK